MSKKAGPMLRSAFLVLLLTSGSISAQIPAPLAFEVATINPVDSQPKDSRFMTMEGPKRFLAKNFPLRLLIAAAFDLNPRAVIGGPSWMDTSKFDIRAVTPGEVRPTREQQMAMVAALLTERFQLVFHREPKDFAIYALSVAKGGSKLRPSKASATDPTSVISTVYPDHVLMPARNASVQDFVAVLQRAILDRPVVDRTGLTGRFDFDLSWAPSEREFNGELAAAPVDTASPPLVVALQQELGLKLEATRGLTSALVIDGVQKPSAN